mgnify:CR=1 FL=1
MTAIDHLRAILSDSVSASIPGAAAAREFLASVESDGEVLDRDARVLPTDWIVIKADERRRFTSAVGAVAYLLRQRGRNKFYSGEDEEPVTAHVMQGRAMCRLQVDYSQVGEYIAALRALGV